MSYCNRNSGSSFVEIINYTHSKMKKIILIVAIVFSGLLMQAQNNASTEELRRSFKKTYLKSTNTESWRLKYDLKFAQKTMIVYMVYQNQSDINMATAEFMFNDGKTKLGYQNRLKMKEMLKITHVKYVISYKGKSAHSTYKGAY